VVTSRPATDKRIFVFIVATSLPATLKESPYCFVFLASFASFSRAPRRMFPSA